MTIRKRACKALAYNLAAGIVENLEVCWQQEAIQITDDEVDFISQEMKKISRMLTMRCNYEELSKIEKV